MPTMQQVIDVLKECMDPEINIDVWTLELIYGIDIDADKVNIKMTFTTPACPYGPVLIETIKEKLKKAEGVKDVSIQIVFLPPWKPSQEIKAMLGIN